MRENRQNNDHLMIAVPLTQGRPSGFLGECDELAIFEVDKRTKKVLYESVHQAPPHVPGLIPSRLHQLGVDVLLTGEMGPLARRLLMKEGLGIVVKTPPETLAQTVRDYLNGEMAEGDASGTADHDPGSSSNSIGREYRASG